jgi:hypothetical protein
MKRIYLTLIAIAFTISFSYAQWTTGPTGPIYYNAGNVGIGTSSPINAGANSRWLTLDGSTYSGGIVYSANGSAMGYDFVQLGGALTHESNATQDFIVNAGSSPVTAMTINSSGNVGIGTTNPSHSLHLYGPAPESLVQAASGNATYALFPTTGSSGRLDFLNSSGTVKAVIASTDGTDAIDFFTGGPNNRMRIDASGNVGIGTSSPISGGGSSKWLTLDGSAYSGGIVYSSNGLAMGYEFVQNGGALTHESNASQDFIVNAASSSVTAMRITSSGSVGIGTTTPDALLAVNGTIHSREVVVNTTGWPDYVFNSTYQLPGLTEVKNYIDQNHRLPGMPSATAAAKDGIKLGELVKLQTKKIEELTLYLIDKDKQLTEQQKQIEQLKQQQEKNQKQEARIAALEDALNKLTTKNK